ncbi:hypothetical protein [Nocardioides sp. R-C-SC26]|uniref:hypothetical protein n=1 Tax=Nocardioides sp. R-C-SC26 TaxID=2870414 RepID=UPI001E6141C9|nr:hypothetical protein [Nocardioides sp. R-C-SC26]
MTPGDPVGRAVGFVDIDPFDLPEELGTEPVTWCAVDGLRSSHLVRGELRTPSRLVIACDLLAVDDAYPAVVAPDGVRVRVHQAWRHGQVLLSERDGDLTVLVPGQRADLEVVLEAITRLARAVGASPSSYAVQIRLDG